MKQTLRDRSASWVGAVLGLGLLGLFALTGFNPITWPYEAVRSAFGVVAGYAQAAQRDKVWIVVDLSIPDLGTSQMSFSNPSVPDMTLAECERSLPSAVPDLKAHISGVPELKGAEFVGAHCVVSASDPVPGGVLPDAIQLMGVGRFVPGVAVYCHTNVAPNSELLDAAAAWVRRNNESMKLVEKAIEREGGLSSEDRKGMDTRLYQAVRAAVEQDDGAVCSSMASRISSGELDLASGKVSAQAFEKVQQALE